jgi:hypothetical protein
VSTPGTKEADYADDRPLEGDACTRFRSGTMRLAYLAQDAPHLQYCVKEAARHMANPTQGAMQRLKRIARFLAGNPRCVQRMYEQGFVDHFSVCVDSNFAGCLQTRKSTSSVYLFHGDHLLRSSATTQGAVTLSTGEAEFAAMVKGASIGFGAVSMARDWGREMKLHVYTDSSAAKGIASRRGAGRIRHLHTALLWVQGKVADKSMRVFKVRGEDNVADLGTKHLSRGVLEKHVVACGYAFERGESSTALRAAL